MSGNRRSGRKRVPTALQRLRGRRIRKDRAHEPAPAPSATPPMPAYLAVDPYAVEEWQGLVADLTAMQVLTIPDGRALALAAAAHADHRRLFETWAQTGFKPVLTQSWTDTEGKVRTKVIENPLVRQLRLQKNLCDQLLGAFGLTPATRSRVQASGATAAATDDFAAFERSRPQVVPFPRRRA